MRKLAFIVFTLVFFSIAVATGCGVQKEKLDEENSITEQQEEVAYTAVNTPYGDLTFQERLKDDMIVEQVEDGENHIISFKTEINGELYQLFDITIGELDGEAHGEIVDAEGNTRNIYVEMYDTSNLLGLTDDDLNKIYAMQEEINVIISFLE